MKETGKDSLEVSVGDDLRYLIEEKQIVISSSISDWGLMLEYYASDNITYKEFKEKKLFMEFAGNTGVVCKYSISLTKGTFNVEKGKVHIIPENGKICIVLADGL